MDKMPDEIYASYDYPALLEGSWQEDWFGLSTKYISEQKHAEEIAALKAEHRAEMAGLCDEIESMKITNRAYDEYSDGIKDGKNDLIEDIIELIKQRISDE